MAQPASATSVPVRAAFAGDDLFLSSEGSGALTLLYYTGSAHALSSKLALLPAIVESRRWFWDDPLRPIIYCICSRALHNRRHHTTTL